MLAQLRMGILPLRIETGRYTNMKIQDRLCQICNCGDVEDELHFLFTCNHYIDERQVFKQELSLRNNDTLGMDDLDLLKYCCTTEPRLLAKYICTIFDKRKEQQHVKK